MGLALRIFVTVGALAYIAHRVPLGQVTVAIAAASVPLILLTTMFTTAFYGLMLPGSVGAGAATLVKYLGHGATPAAAPASMIVNRLFDTGTIITLGLAFWGLAHNDPVAGDAQGLAVPLPVMSPFLFLAFHLLRFGRPRTFAASRRRSSGSDRNIEVASRRTSRWWSINARPRETCRPAATGSPPASHCPGPCCCLRGPF